MDDFKLRQRSEKLENIERGIQMAHDTGQSIVIGEYNDTHVILVTTMTKEQFSELSSDSQEN